MQKSTRNGDLPVAYAAAVSKGARSPPAAGGGGSCLSARLPVCPSVRPPSWWPARPRARGCWRGGDAVCGECPFLCLVGSGKVLHPGFTHLPSLPELPLNPIKTPLERGFSSPGTARRSWPPGEGRFGSEHTFIVHKELSESAASTKRPPWFGARNAPGWGCGSWWLVPTSSKSLGGGN